MRNIVVLFSILKLSLGSPIPDDWSPAATFQVPSSSDGGAPTLTSALINVTRLINGTSFWEEDEYGRFGSGYIGPAKGVLVHVSNANDHRDHTGCNLPLYSTRPDGSLPLPGELWLALVKRGRCSFETKVQNAYNSGAVGVIVYNDRDSNNLDKMKLSSESGRNISAIFTYKWKGEQMASYLENNTKVFVHITVGRTEPLRGTTINRTSVLFVSTTFIILMIISLAWLIFYYVQRFRHIHAKDKLSKRLSSAAKKALSKIPTKTIKPDDKEIKEGECCAVCIEPYKSSEVLRILPCSHEFHKGCIDPWLLEHRTCPMCKMDILKHYGFVFSGSQESILAIDNEDAASLDTAEEANTRRNGNGVSPLPQIRAEVTLQQYTYCPPNDDDCSRSSTPVDTALTLNSTGRYPPVPSQYCINCRAATANVLVNSESNDAPSCAKSEDSVTDELAGEQVPNKKQIN